METVRSIGRAQLFRSHHGAIPPGFSEADALRRGELPDDYSLGLWDVGMVDQHGNVLDWTPVQIVAGEHFEEQVPIGCRGGAACPKRKSGWVQDVLMYDARSGDFVLAYSF